MRRVADELFAAGDTSEWARLYADRRQRPPHLRPLAPLSTILQSVQPLANRLVHAADDEPESPDTIPVYSESQGDEFDADNVPPPYTPPRPPSGAPVAPKAPVRQDSANAVYVFAFTWNLWDSGANRPPPPTDDQFSELFVVLKRALASLNCKYIFQLERGGTANRLHYQGYIHIVKGAKLRPQTLATTLNGQGMYGIHISPASGAGKEALKTYCMKDETRVAGPWKDTDPKVLTAAESKRLQLIDPDHLYAWQRTVRDAIIGPCGDRKIDWLVDTGGNAGKSSFGKLMVAQGHALLLPFADAKDANNLVVNAGERKAYIFDLTRTKPAAISADDTYSVMEQIKNGYIVNTKYQTKIHIQPPAHVWVFANRPPRFSALSGDRWAVWQLKNGILVPFDRKDYEKWQDDQEVRRQLEGLRAQKRQKLVDARVKEIWAQEQLDADDDRPISTIVID